MRWLDVIGVGLRLIGGAYGAFFLVAGAAFLYWSARGLLGYASGVRAAWTDPVAAGAGVVAAALSFWVGSKLVRRGIPPSRTVSSSGNPELDTTLEEAMRLDRSDPEAATQLLDSYFMREAENTERRREELRRRAPQDVQAATALRRELQEELEANAAARRDIVKHAPELQRATFLRDMDETDRQLQSELVQLDAIIEQRRVR